MHVMWLYSCSWITDFVCLAIVALSAVGMWQLKKRVDAVPPSVREKGQRIALLDNARCMLQIFVVLTHMLDSTMWYSHGWPQDVLEATKLVAMFPAVVKLYCFISGLLSRQPPSAEAFKAVFFKLFMPLVLWSFIFMPLSESVLKTPEPDLAAFFPDGAASVLRYGIDQLLDNSGGIQWFLQSLVVWKLLNFALLWALPDRPGGRLASATMAACIGLYLPIPPYFHLGRAVATFPIFVLGTVTPLDKVCAVLPPYRAAAPAGAALLLGMLGLHMWPWYAWDLYRDTPAWLDGQSRGAQAGRDCGPVQGLLFPVRYLAEMVMELAKGAVIMFLLTPRETCCLTEPGKHGLYSYLLHWPPLHWRSQLQPWLNPGLLPVGLQPVVWVVFFFESAVIVFYLTAWPTRMMLGPLVEPRWLEMLWDRVVALGRATCGASDATPGRVGEHEKGATPAPLVDDAPGDPVVQRLLPVASSYSRAPPFDFVDVVGNGVAASEGA